MSAVQLRGGFPYVFRKSITSAGYAVALPGVSFHVRVHSDMPCNVYFRESDYIANINFIQIPTPDASQLWEGPAHLEKVWFKAISANANIEMTAFMRVA